MYFKVFLLSCLVTNAYSGFSHLTLEILGDRIRGGEDALPGQFPHQVSLQWGRKPFIKDVHFCGGTILGTQWILTAAHCIFFVRKLPLDGVFVVKAGKHDLSKTESTEQVSVVDKCFTHKLYNTNVTVGPNDIALIKLLTPLKFNERVAKALLPEKNAEPAGNATLSGWGAVNSDADNPISSVILQTIEVPIINRGTCNTAVKNIFNEEGVKLTMNLVNNTNVCTGPLTGGISACGGDSGGPLVEMNKDDQMVVVGIVSWGMKPCGRKGAPAVFTRVSSFIDWIEKIIKENQ